MNIKQAKKQIKNAIIAYNTQDEYGNYKIPVSSQRPVFIVGAPGIGKTAIMEQIAKELDVAIVSYSMTHHTRQSALGLPFIVNKNYGGKEYSISEYTMSEIIASVYEEIENSHKDKGILFLDEINCVSETLAPSMLQFLQYKTFGRHQIPEGWIVVTAGNPPEYNNSVKEFDIAMLDRLKKIEVEPDYQIWKEYALNTHVHPVVTSYLSIKPQNFYSILTTVDGKSFVTARSWDDLSQMIMLYEENELDIDYDLMCQYIQDEKIAKDFSHYYSLYQKYQSDYQVNDILSGTVTKDIKERAINAKFDERLSLISLINSQLIDSLTKINHYEETLKTVLTELNPIQDHYNDFILQRISFYKESSLKTDTKANKAKTLDIKNLFQYLLEKISESSSNPNDIIKKTLKEKINLLKDMDSYCQKALENVFIFFEECFGTQQEMLILVTELTVNEETSQYIFKHGCPKYYEHNKQLLFDDNQNELKERIDSLHLNSIKQKEGENNA